IVADLHASRIAQRHGVVLQLPSDIIRTPRTVLDGVARDFVSDQEIPHVGESSGRRFGRMLQSSKHGACGDPDQPSKIFLVTVWSLRILEQGLTGSGETGLVG